MSRSEPRRIAPMHVQALNKRIANEAARIARPELRIRRAIANTVVGQLLPPGVVKGGTALKLRVGEPGSRFTPDLDAARHHDWSLDNYIDALETNLREGWGGFSGRVVQLDPASPPDVPTDYVMVPFELKLDYHNRSWLTVRFELSHDEIGSTAVATSRIAPDIVELFATLGLPEPAPVPLLIVEHQIAQKLHACTSPDRNGTNERAHDLVDLQLLVDDDPPDLAVLDALARRLFAARRGLPWPPTVQVWPGWADLYREAADGLNVLHSVDEAAAWANDLIAAAQKAAD